MKIKLKDSSHISQHVGSLCSEAPDTTFTSKIDVDKWAAVPGNYIQHFTVHKFICDKRERVMGCLMFGFLYGFFTFSTIFK